MKNLEGCPFCIDFEEYSGNIPERTILESDNFRVFPTVGQITDGGYLLIVPKEHYLCQGSFPDEFFPELEEVKEETNRRISTKYERPIFLEHGAIGQTVSHAHMHAIPFPRDKDIFEVYYQDFPFFDNLKELKDLKRVWNTRGHYLYYEVNSHKFAFYTPAVPMYGRIVVANELGVPERVNWRTMERELDERLIRDTLEKLKK